MARLPWLGAIHRRYRQRSRRTIAVMTVVAHVAGALTSVQAIMTTRTAQGATAWAVSLNTCPYVAVPAYWVFGRTKFEGYIGQRRIEERKAGPVLQSFIASANQAGLVATTDPADGELMTQLVKLPATTHNDVELLRDGDAIFPSIFQGIDAARNYLLVQFYIVRDDNLGKELQSRLIAARRRGVMVKFIYDEIGSSGLSDSYMETLRNADVEILPFNSMKGLTNRFQINFRNHRKMVVADGNVAWVGGANIGDEYTSGHKKMTPIHDTFVKVTGPAVQTIQVSFREDWLWASGTLLELNWKPQPAPNSANKTVWFIPSGPADRFETCTLYFLRLIDAAKERLWIATPYFVPDEQIVSALKMAALRGVDVRIVMPDKGDSKLSDLSGWGHVDALQAAGVRFWRHKNGFMHQKVIVVDSGVATVGTANFDNRSFRLNFEITVEVHDAGFNAQAAEMLTRDFEDSQRIPAGEFGKRSFLFRFAVKAASLLSPIQ